MEGGRQPHQRFFHTVVRNRQRRPKAQFLKCSIRQKVLPHMMIIIFHTGGQLKEQVSVFGQIQLLSLLFKQLCLILLLQLADVCGDRRLCDVQQLRSSRIIQRFCSS